MNLSLWVTYSGDHTLAKLGAVFATSLPFDVAHALGNAAFCLAFGPALVRALQRFRTRFEVTWRPAPPPRGVALALLALVARCSAAARRARRSPAAVAYLERRAEQRRRARPAPGAGSTQMHTGWAALGLAAAGRNPRDVERGGRDIVDYIRANAAALRGDLGERTRTILALRAAGASPTRAGACSYTHSCGSFFWRLQRECPRPRPLFTHPRALRPTACSERVPLPAHRGSHDTTIRRRSPAYLIFTVHLPCIYRVFSVHGSATMRRREESVGYRDQALTESRTRREPTMRYGFGDYTLDTHRYELRRAGQLVPLRPKVFHVLAYLLAQRHRVACGRVDMPPYAVVDIRGIDMTGGTGALVQSGQG